MGVLPESSPIEAAHALIWLTAEGLHSLARMGKVGHARCHRTSGWFAHWRAAASALANDSQAASCRAVVDVPTLLVACTARLGTPALRLPPPVAHPPLKRMTERQHSKPVTRRWFIHSQIPFFSGDLVFLVVHPPGRNIRSVAASQPTGHTPTRGHDAARGPCYASAESHRGGCVTASHGSTFARPARGERARQPRGPLADGC